MFGVEREVCKWKFFLRFLLVLLFFKFNLVFIEFLRIFFVGVEVNG